MSIRNNAEIKTSIVSPVWKWNVPYELKGEGDKLVGEDYGKKCATTT